jgi:transposase InsO family protein
MKFVVPHNVIGKTPTGFMQISPSFGFGEAILVNDLPVVAQELIAIEVGNSNSIRFTLGPRLKPRPSSSLQHRMPFPIRALQVDGGSEFTAEFEEACQQRGLHRFVLPPRSPKLNGAVEPANRTHTEEFYQVTPCSLEMKKLNRELRRWEKIYNTVRPHQALGYLTPQQFLRQNLSQRKE